ncbi:MAG: zinc ABC transporter permease AztB [Microthrixaceae bacterium]|nr:zinc ABC transporter permease AztB [Microthrixaceae bacterium]
MNWLTDAFEPAFMQRALAAGILAVVATSVVGTWVVIRGLAFMGDALAHGVVPGLALATLWGFSPVVGALAAAVVMGLAVTVVSHRTNLREDTGIGLLFVGMLALGVVIVSRSTSFATDVTNLLFGEILGVTTSDLWVQAGAAVLVALTGALLYRPLLALSFDRSKAATLGMHPRWTHAALMVMLAVSIVASFRAIGTLLVFGLLVGPPATAALLVRRISTAMVLSVLIGSLWVVLGLVVSFHLGTAGGATIAGLSVAGFFVVLWIVELRAKLRSRVEPGVSSS